MSLRYAKYITRGMIRAEPNTLFVFGDNVKRHGFGGQAKEMRGEFNAVGIPTKWKPSTDADAYLHDNDFDIIRGDLDAAFGRIVMHIANGGDVVWPADGVGTGLAELPTRAPLIWEYIEIGRKALEKLAAGSSLPPLQEPDGSQLASPDANRPASP